MTDEELRLLIAKLLTLDKNGAGDARITVGTPLADGGLHLSSLELVRLLVGLEDHLDIQLDDEEVMNTRLDTVDDVVALVRDSLPS